MPKTREILGHVSVQIAGKKRKCTRNPGKHSIPKGEPCLVIKGGTYNAEKSYCRECAADILELAEKQLEQFKLSLAESPV